MDCIILGRNKERAIGAREAGGAPAHILALGIPSRKSYSRSNRHHVKEWSYVKELLHFRYHNVGWLSPSMGSFWGRGKVS